MTERRKHKRFKIKEGMFAAIAGHNLIGKIKNIGKGGLAFACIASGEQDFHVSEIEIFSDDNGFILREVPFKMVFEVNLDHIPSSSFDMKQFSGQFIEMTRSQISQLDYLLKNYVIAEV